ncbi:hypothetical protein LUZ61_011627 [Rhynchospora tenuis]|uniref:Agenet domain-containing protein n=1 Tax=Rhynchospora tenuis TaxID=198213 RepID=A0AAD6F0C6_9POAL|nr:hypothetical protein LUZ61_011627 [Rhynchospora tenuis]
MAMNMKNHMPFKAGQIVEAKSFIQGYRGAWFRCRVKDTRIRGSFLECMLEYFDFPDEKIQWTNIYRIPPKERGASDKQRKKELMIRPSFPPFHKVSEHAPQHSPAEVKAVVNDVWKIGDLVDLWCEGCFWSGKIIKLSAVDSVQVELHAPPAGEGGTYEGVLKDLRPSLNWSLEEGWSVPISEFNGDSWYTARLVQQSSCISLDNESGASVKALDPSFLSLKSRKEAPDNTLSEKSNPISLCFAGDNSNHNIRTDVTLNPTAASSRSHSDLKNRDIGSSSGDEDSREELSPEGQPDIIDESIMELEEVASKIRWLKGLLQFGFTWSNDTKASWKFLHNSKQ